MGRELLINNPNKEKIINDICEIINNEFITNKIEKRVNPEDMLKRLEDPELVKRYVDANNALDKEKEIKKYGKELEEKIGLKFLPGFQRHASLFMTIPEGTEEEKKQIEEKNIEILKRYSDPERAEEVMKEDIKNYYECDKKMFFPRNFNEAYETYTTKRGFVEGTFVIQSMIQNNGLVINEGMAENYSYYKEFITQGLNAKESILNYASEFTLLFPDDLTIDEKGLILTPLSKYVDENKKEFSNDAFMKHFSFQFYESEKNNKKFYEFFEKNDKNNDFLYEKEIGGTNFYQELKDKLSNDKEIKIEKQDGNAKEILYFSNFEKFKENNEKIIDKKRVRNEIKNSSIDKKFLDKKFIDKEGKFKTNSKEELLLYYAMAKKLNNKKVSNDLGKYIKAASCTRKELNDAVAKYKDKKISMDEINRARETVDIKKNPKEYFFLMETINKKNKERNFFNRVFGKESKQEKALLSNMKREMIENGYTSLDYDKALEGKIEIKEQVLDNNTKESTKEVDLKPVREPLDLTSEVIAGEKSKIVEVKNAEKTAVKEVEQGLK